MLASLRMKQSKEIEFKWQCESLQDFQKFIKAAHTWGHDFSQTKKVSIHDYYLDTSQRFFGERHVSCRLRKQDKRWELTLKSKSKLKRGLAERLEKTWRLGHLLIFSQALNHCQNHILKETLNSQKLQVIFEIRNKRRMKQLWITPHTQAAISFDSVSISRKSRSFPMLEIELEFIRGNSASFLSFIQKISRLTKLKAAKTSKVERALKTFGLRTRKGP
ncbi:MAG: CYTH domain-containing protein [Chlamydiae bacterium]|nr:CYTH domain-containing protein [Chlamydiota bacterium]MBI3266450.1 CYTH domain-containing protein [Chlamydiota bacterium]